MSVFPGDPLPELTEIATIPVDGYRLQAVRAGEHTGTHWGAPAHFDPDGLTADQLDADDLLRPAVKLDVRERAGADPDYAITVDDLLAWEAEHGRIPSGAAVIAWTGWAQRWGTDAFPNLDELGVLHQPGFSIEAAHWLLDTGRLHRQGALGTDTFSPDRGIDADYTVSKLLYREHRISLECLANLEALPTTGAWVLAGGTINRGGTGSSAAVFALVDDSARR
ncbi:MAG: cyclase family protein [Aldersonia sp.]|nr:cyclase family protein [Aldersonia sp.]